MHISELAASCKAFVAGNAGDLKIDTLSTDSRKLPANPEQCLFVALRSRRSDGHKYIAAAYEQGVRAFLVAEAPSSGDFPGAAFLIVFDTLQALQAIAVAVRKKYDIPVLGITGSNGKTVVKEWLYQLLHDRINIVRSPGSYNSQIGVPLSVWQMKPEHELGIFEAGLSEPGEMDKLEKIIRPSVGIFTNIGEAHNQGFLNARQKINEKLHLFRNAHLLIYCRDYHELNEAISLFAQNLKVSSEHNLHTFSWSHKTDATLRITAVEKEAGKTTITGIYERKERTISIPFTDAASVENAINCWCYLLVQQIPSAEIKKRMAALKPISMRLELRPADNNSVLINDAYNADLNSLNIALDMLAQQKQYPEKAVILSDMQQTGMPDGALYAQISRALAEKEIKYFIGIGPAMMQHRSIFEQLKDDTKLFFYPSTNDFLKEVPKLKFEDTAILLKGARSFAFERIALFLEQKIHPTVLSVSLTALSNNLAVFRRRLNEGVKTMAMVKASSYGSGGHEVAQHLQNAGVDYLTVAYPDEGVALRKAGISLPIMVMSPSIEAFDRMILWKLEPEIFNMRSLNRFMEVAEKIGVQAYPVHIKLDTGMHRLGFMPGEIDTLLRTLKPAAALLKVASVFSHLAASEDALQEDFTHSQAISFMEMSDRIADALGYKPMFHLCNTAGIVRFPEYHFDMVRLGLGLYGIDGSGELDNQLQQVSTLRTVIAQIKHIPAGDSIGYSRKGRAEQDMRIATICIGYADGYPRALGNGNAYVLINNQAAPVIGAIAMDMCMVDITAIENVQEGDEAIIFGPALPIQQLASRAGTIPYEIMTGISQRVKRVYVNEG